MQVKLVLFGKLQDHFVMTVANGIVNILNYPIINYYVTSKINMQIGKKINCSSIAFKDIHCAWAVIKIIIHT